MASTEYAFEADLRRSHRECAAGLKLIQAYGGGGFIEHETERFKSNGDLKPGAKDAAFNERQQRAEQESIDSYMDYRKDIYEKRGQLFDQKARDEIEQTAREHIKDYKNKNADELERDRADLQRYHDQDLAKYDYVKALRQSGMSETEAKEQFKVAEEAANKAAREAAEKSGETYEPVLSETHTRARVEYFENLTYQVTHASAVAPAAEKPIHNVPAPAISVDNNKSKDDAPHQQQTAHPHINEHTAHPHNHAHTMPHAHGNHQPHAHGTHFLKTPHKPPHTAPHAHGGANSHHHKPPAHGTHPHHAQHNTHVHPHKAHPEAHAHNKLPQTHNKPHHGQAADHREHGGGSFSVGGNDPHNKAQRAGAVLRGMDKNHDGMVVDTKKGQGEFSGAVRQMGGIGNLVKTLDQNGDGKVTNDEMRVALEASGLNTDKVGMDNAIKGLGNLMRQNGVQYNGQVASMPASASHMSQKFDPTQKIR